MPQVRVPKSFFIKERDNLYADWPTAYWREMLQNSTDANARNIRITVEGDELVQMTVEDDGCGMDRSIVENVFFALGETTKANEDGVGGFGRARILTCFAMDNYQFWTDNLHCEGNGSNYQINEVPDAPLVKGCVFRMYQKQMSAERMLIALDNVLRRSQLHCKVYVNGEQFLNWMQKRRHVRNASFGDIHLNKSAYSPGRVAVRVRGLWMFDVRARVDKQVVVEIDPKISRKVLLVNRDGLRQQYQDDLYSWVSELAIDVLSALKSRRRKTRLVKSGRMLRTERRLKVDEIPDIVVTVGEVEQREAAFERNRPVTSPVGEVSEDEVFIIQTQEGDRFDEALGTVYISDETENPNMIRVIDRFDPTKWQVRRAHGHLYRDGGNRMKLLLAWRAACEVAIHALLDLEGMDGIDWMVGWKFSDSAGAAHTVVEGGHALLLNPVDDEGKMRFKLSRREDVLELMALAKHEVAHVLVSYHDEEWARTVTHIDAKFDPAVAMREMKRAVRSA